MAIANDESESIITETLEKFCYILFIDPDGECAENGVSGLIASASGGKVR